jgi:RecA-family ATPase
MQAFDLEDVDAFENPRIIELRAAMRSASEPVILPAQAYLVKNWLDAGGVSLLFGASNTGKTFLALDIAFHIASGMDWQGNRVKRGSVLYVVAEGGGGFTRRLKALEIGSPSLFDGGRGNFTYLSKQVDLSGDQDVHAIKAAVGDKHYDLLIVDTLAMTFGDGNENDAQDMTKFVRQVKALGESLGGHVMLVHHPGKDASRGARGSSSLRAAIETEIEIAAENSSGTRTAVITKQREGATGLKVTFGFEQIEIGLDDDGEKITSCVVRQTSSDSSTRRRLLKGINQVCLQALQEAASKHGNQLTHTAELPSARQMATIEEWWAAFLEKRVDKTAKAESKRKAFNRAVEFLSNEDYIRVQEDNAWVVST